MFRELPHLLEQGLRKHYELPRGKISRQLMTLLKQLEGLETPRKRVWRRKNAKE